jgi:hypothetical protein
MQDVGTGRVSGKWKGSCWPCRNDGWICVLCSNEAKRRTTQVSILPEQKGGSKALKPTSGVKTLPRKLDREQQKSCEFKNKTRWRTKSKEVKISEFIKKLVKVYVHVPSPCPMI